MSVTTLDSGSVTIRNAVAHGWPAWLWPTFLLTPMYLLLGLWLLVMSQPSMGGFAWFWLAYAGLYMLAVWLTHLAVIELDATRITIRSHLWSKSAPMDDVLRIDARKMPWRYASRFRPAPYAMDVWLAGYRHWRLQYVEPEAGDRLLAALHGYQKPIWVVRTA